LNRQREAFSTLVAHNMIFLILFSMRQIFLFYVLVCRIQLLRRQIFLFSGLVCRIQLTCDKSRFKQWSLSFFLLKNYLASLVKKTSHLGATKVGGFVSFVYLY